ncbi:hypothetical protein [Moraxella lincolnii]|uniref:hypothetical protein n=1 Tax=Lwoffella lincolnii TaxID=90241 RepID=UPI0039844A82
MVKPPQIQRWLSDFVIINLCHQSPPSLKLSQITHKPNETNRFIPWWNNASDGITPTSILSPSSYPNKTDQADQIFNLS